MTTTWHGWFGLGGPISGEPALLNHHSTPTKEMMIMKKYFTAIAFILVSIFAGQGTVKASPIVPCQQMLKPYFDWAKKGQIGGVGDFKEFAIVYVTVTQHTNSSATTVNSPVINHTQVYYTGAIPHFEDILFKDKVLQWEAKFYANHNSAELKLSQTSDVITINESGQVMVQRKIAGKNFLGRPPVVLEGTCYDGVITAVFTTKIGAMNGIYTISLKQGKGLHG